MSVNQPDWIFLQGLPAGSVTVCPCFSGKSPRDPDYVSFTILENCPDLARTYRPVRAIQSSFRSSALSLHQPDRLFLSAGPVCGRFKVRPCFYPKPLKEILLMSRLPSSRTAKISAERIAQCEQSNVPIAQLCESIHCSPTSCTQ